MKSSLFLSLLIGLIIFLSSFIEKQPSQYHFNDKPAYRIFTKAGKQIEYKKMLTALQLAEVVLVGEQHNNSLGHWLELSLLKDLDSEKLVAGAEMFNAIDQEALNSYLKNEILAEDLSKKMTLWSNFETDYKPLLDYSAKAKIPFLGSNCERSYARMVAKNGIQSLDTLLPEKKKFLAPLPIEVDLALPGYKNFMEGDVHGHGMVNGRFMAEAQALKDATMAYFIFNNLKKDRTFIHFNGAYHSDNYEGINWYLKKYKPTIKVTTISMVEQENLSRLDKGNVDKADYIIVIPSDMTKTY